jgi:hypothetical protein
MVEITILTVIIGLLAVIAVPSFLKARDRAMRDLCIYNLRQIESAKAAWAFQHGAKLDIELEPEDLNPFFSNGLVPTCPAGGDYEIGFLYEPPRCTSENRDHIYSPEGDEDIPTSSQTSAGKKPAAPPRPPAAPNAPRNGAPRS